MLCMHDNKKGYPNGLPLSFIAKIPGINRQQRKSSQQKRVLCPKTL